MRWSDKNISSKQIALIAASLIAFLNFCICYFIVSKWYFTLICSFIIAFFAYFLILFLIDKFLNRKIKLIYKLIAKEKNSEREDRILDAIPEENLDTIQEKVENWTLERRKEIQKLQSNEAYRKEFLMNLAHELRTPIFAIQGYISTLLDGELENSEVNYKFLKNALKSSERLSNIVEDINKISNYEANKIILNKQDFIIQHLINEVFVELDPKSKEQGIKMEIKKGCESPISVFGDREKIKQVISNLTDNAIKYGIKNGHVFAGCYILDDEVLIEISDNGIGIKEENIPRVFERFYRTEEAREKDKSGHGIGLALSKHIVEAHNSVLSCRSTKGVGTTFGFTLKKPD